MIRKSPKHSRTSFAEGIPRGTDDQMNETPKPAVSVSLTTTTREGEAGPDDPTEVVEIRSVDDGPGIPPHEIAR